MLNGISIVLYEQTETGRDEFNAPIIEETPVTIDDVLIGQPTSDDITNALSMYGRKIAYTMAIPKGDTHEWENCKVRFYGEDFRVIGIPTEGIEANIPLRWNKKVQVERYEG